MSAFSRTSSFSSWIDYSEMDAHEQRKRVVGRRMLTYNVRSVSVVLSPVVHLGRMSTAYGDPASRVMLFSPCIWTRRSA